MARMAAPPALTASSDPASERTRDAALRNRFQRWLPLGYLAPALALYAIFVLWPLVRVLWLSLQNWTGYGPETFAGLANFTAITSDPVFRAALRNSVIWELAAVVCLPAVGLIVALAARAWRVGNPILLSLFVPALLPAAAVAAIWTLVYSPTSGLLNTALRSVGLGTLASSWLGDPHFALPALFVAWAWSVFGISALVFSVALAGVGREWLELAVVEGAGRWWRFRNVLAPALRRPAGILLIVNAALAGQVFDLIFVTTGGGPGYATLTLPVDMYGRAFGGNAGQGSADAVIQVVLGLGLAAIALLLIGGASGDDMQGETLPSRGRRPIWGQALAGIALVLTLLPFVWLVIVALGFNGLIAGVPRPTLNPSTWGWHSFGAVWSTGMGKALWRSAIFATSAVALTTVLSVPAAFALANLVRSRVLGGILLAVLTVGLFQPTVVLVIPLFSLLRSFGLLDSPLGIVLPEVARTLPFAILLLWAFLASGYQEILAAASVDGAGPWQQMIRVAAPVAAPVLAAVAIWAFVTSWNEYLLPTIVSQDGSQQTVPTVLASSIGSFDTQYPLLAAGSLFALAPVLAVSLLLTRSGSQRISSLRRRS